MDINYELYKVFYYVAKTLSFSDASKRLFISQSAVSQSIKALEKKLNQHLFIRSTKRVKLTPEGEVLFKHFINFGVKLISAAVGAVIYFMIRAFVLYLGLNANDMKLISAIIVALALCIPTMSQKMAVKKAYTEGDDSDA